MRRFHLHRITPGHNTQHNRNEANVDESTPLSPVRRLRSIALGALLCAGVVWFSSSMDWWRDTSRLSGTQLEAALAASPDEPSRSCFSNGGVMINGHCAVWDVTHPALGMSTEQDTTIDVTGAAVVNSTTPASMFGMPSATVFALLAFGLVALAAVFRSLFAAIGSVVFGAQAFRALSDLAAMINAPVEGVPALQTTMWFGLFKATVMLGTLVLGGGILAWVGTERAKERRERIANGTYVSLRDRLHALANAAVSSAATKAASGPGK
jgi:hypothetical protein